MIFNNVLLICSTCFMKGPSYVNSRCVAFGMFWYLFSIFCFFMTHFQYFDFLLLFDDGFLFSTGLSLYYSYQTYEKYDLTTELFINEHIELWKFMKEEVLFPKE